MERTVPGIGRDKTWDVTWQHDSKYRLLISLKSILQNISGTVPNRIDDLIGEVANAQLAAPEIVVGYVVVFDVARGRHVVYPLHASLQERCRAIGFDNLAPIIWHKIANARYEVEREGGFLGKPYEPNAIVKNDIEYVLMQRKPGGYRSPTLGARLLSLLGEDQHRQWFRQIWTMPGASTRAHPAPFPLELAERLVRMFSFVGDTVLDPFAGTGTVNAAAAKWGRDSVGVEVDPRYYRQAVARLEAAGPLQVAITTERWVPAGCSLTGAEVRRH